MHVVFVDNSIDWSGSFRSLNPMLVLLWAIAALKTECRSGEALFYHDRRLSDVK
jgi:hypothetical protein